MNQDRPVPIRPSRPKSVASQLAFDLGGLAMPTGPGWESLSESSRAEAVALLARLLAKAGVVAAEEAGD